MNDIDLNDYRETGTDDADTLMDIRESLEDTDIDADEIVTELEIDTSIEGSWEFDEPASPPSNPTPEPDKPERIELHERDDVLEVTISRSKPEPLYGRHGMASWRKPDEAEWTLTVKACSPLVDVFEECYQETEPLTLETGHVIAEEAYVTGISHPSPGFKIGGMPTVTIDLESNAYNRKVELDLP